MFNLKDIVILLACLVSIISTWGIYYFIARIMVTRRRWDEPEIPSPEELSEFYEQLQKYDQHPR